MFLARVTFVLYVHFFDEESLLLYAVSSAAHAHLIVLDIANGRCDQFDVIRRIPWFVTWLTSAWLIGLAATAA